MRFRLGSLGTAVQPDIALLYCYRSKKTGIKKLVYKKVKKKKNFFNISLKDFVLVRFRYALFSVPNMLSSKTSEARKRLEPEIIQKDNNCKLSQPVLEILFNNSVNTITSGIQ